MKDSGAIPDSAEYWWPQYSKSRKKIRRVIAPHDCKPRGGEKGTPFRRFCKVCNKPFSREYFRLKGLEYGK